ncbi:MAG: ankyrin repeat domain-containing protein [Bacteroidota bacterium]
MVSSDVLNAFVNAACVPIGPGVGSHQDGNIEAANRLLQSNPSIAYENIYTAAILGESEMVKNFLAEDPASATQKGGTRNWDALTYLCFSRYLRLDKDRSEGFELAAKTLLDAGADANSGFYENDHHPKPEWEPVLYGAAGVAHHAGVTALLVAHGADPNEVEVAYHSPETYDNAALQVSIESGKLTQASLAMMLLRKADFHDRDGMKLLLDGGADPNSITMWGYTALHQALRRDNALSNIELLLDRGADPLLPNTADGHSGLAFAITRGRADVLRALQEKGFNPELKEIEKLLYACVMDDTETVKSIASQQPELLQVIHNYGGILLAEFAGNSNAAAIKQLLDLSVPVTAIYRGDGYFGIPSNSTALHVAAWKGWPDAVQVLIERGAPVDAVDGNGQTPLQLAIRACVDSYWTSRRNTKSIELLLAAGASKQGIVIPTGYDEADKLLAEK